MPPPPEAWSLIVCGGGSGGHLFPALAVIEQLKESPRPPRDILFLGGERAIERRIFDANKAESISLPSVPASAFRARPVASFRSLWQSVRSARKILLTMPRPVILGTGGYGSVPGVIAGRRVGAPVILLEQNLIPGQATAWLSRFARVVCTSFAESSRWLPRRCPVEQTGNPVRRAFMELAMRPIAEERKTLLVLGGSQGATAINSAMIEFVKKHAAALAGRTIVHHAGESDVERLTEAYQRAGVSADVSGFFDDIDRRFRSAGLIISRAGATTLAEIACARAPTILVPYPKSARDHQRANARFFVEQGAAMMVEQDAASGDFNERLSVAIQELLADETRREAMQAALARLARPDAARQVCEVVLRNVPG